MKKRIVLPVRFFLLIAVIIFLLFRVYANPEARRLYDAGMEHYQKQEYDSALECFQKVVKKYRWSRWTDASRKKIAKIREIEERKARELRERRFGERFWEKQQREMRKRKRTCW